MSVRSVAEGYASGGSAKLQGGMEKDQEAGDDDEGGQAWTRLSGDLSCRFAAIFFAVIQFVFTGRL